MKMHCDITVITPSFNMLPYLLCAAASIADQSHPGVEHLVMDGASTDGTVAWLDRAPFSHMNSVSEPDLGMYDALNKGLKIAHGDILAYLNCDEQYLPGTLEFVAHYFRDHPDVDILFGDTLLIRPDGSIIAFRKGYQPRWYYILTSHLYVLSCTMFFRRRIIEEGFFFDTHYRAAGDAQFVVRLLRHGYKARHIRRYFSAFTMTGKNLSAHTLASAEQKELWRGAPLFLRVCKPLINVIRLIEKFLSRAYFQGGPIEYALYPYNQNPSEKQRTPFRAEKVSSRWRFM